MPLLDQRVLRAWIYQIKFFVILKFAIPYRMNQSTAVTIDDSYLPSKVKKKMEFEIFFTGTNVTSDARKIVFLLGNVF